MMTTPLLACSLLAGLGVVIALAILTFARYCDTVCTRLDHLEKAAMNR